MFGHLLLIAFTFHAAGEVEAAEPTLEYVYVCIYHMHTCTHTNIHTYTHTHIHASIKFLLVKSKGLPYIAVLLRQAAHAGAPPPPGVQFGRIGLRYGCRHSYRFKA